VQSNSLPEILRLSVLRLLMELHTSMPGVVLSYNAAKQEADVRPQLKLLQSLPTRQKKLWELPVLPDVPVCWPGGGGLGLHAPLAAGDTVLLIFCERSIDRWRASSGTDPVDPGDHRLHPLGGAVALPLIHRLGTEWSTLGAGSTLNLGEDGAPLDFVALAAKVLTELQAIKTAYDLHVHTSAAPASPTSPPTVPLPTPASVAATKVKAT
jgi:hypothetical protein